MKGHFLITREAKNKGKYLAVKKHMAQNCWANNLKTEYRSTQFMQKLEGRVPKKGKYYSREGENQEWETWRKSLAEMPYSLKSHLNWKCHRNRTSRAPNVKAFLSKLFPDVTKTQTIPLPSTQLHYTPIPMKYECQTSAWHRRYQHVVSWNNLILQILSNKTSVLIFPGLSFLAVQGRNQVRWHKVQDPLHSWTVIPNERTIFNVCCGYNIWVWQQII